MSGPGTDGRATRAGFVAIVGWTNVGKSTLLNRLVGTKLAAVADAPQTTRNRIVGVRTVAGRGQAVFIDTPGFHEPRHKMNRAMVEVARRSLEGVDLCLLVLDAALGLGPGDRTIAERLAPLGERRLAVLNKVDLVSPKSRLLPMLETVVNGWGFPEAIPVSALDGEGCDILLQRTLDLLPEGAPMFPDDYLTDQPERHLVAEWIREKLLRHTREEIPHAAAVKIETWTEREDGLVSIEATILVERDSQKAIVIGKGGALLKRIGTEAREEIERLLDTRVFLRLWVTTQPGWRDDDRILRDLGLS